MSDNLARTGSTKLEARATKQLKLSTGCACLFATRVRKICAKLGPWPVRGVTLRDG